MPVYLKDGMVLVDGGLVAIDSACCCACGIVEFDVKLTGEYVEGGCSPPDNCPLLEFDSHFHVVVVTMSGSPCSGTNTGDFSPAGSCIGCSANASLSEHVSCSVAGTVSSYSFTVIATVSGGECTDILFTMIRTSQSGNQTFTDHFTDPCGNDIQMDVVVGFA